MSNIIPPLLSNSPPPVIDPPDDEDDEFGDFTTAVGLSSYSCDVLSLPSTPKQFSQVHVPSVDNDTPPSDMEVVENIKRRNENIELKAVDKDNLDRRKSDDCSNSICDIKNSENSNNLENNLEPSKVHETFSIVNNIYSSDLFPNLSTNNASQYNGFCYYLENPPDIEPESNESEFNCSENISNSFGASTNQKEELNQSNFEVSLNIVDSDCAQVTVPDELVATCNNNSSVLEVLNEADFSFDTDIKNTEIQLETGVSSKEVVKENKKFKHDNKIKSLVANVLCEKEIHSEFISSNIDTNSQYVEYENKNEFIEQFSTNVDDLESLSCATIVNKNDNEYSTKLETAFVKCFKESEDLVELPVEANEINFDDDDFGDFENHAIEEQAEIKQNEDDDEFGDFSELSCTDNNTSVLITDSNDVLRKAEVIVTQMFPVCETKEDIIVVDFMSDNIIFDQIKDITDTTALSYQWAKSNSQNALLQALNIDTRNILYGPRWNESMPRYAATLGFAPLEPVKTEAVTSSQNFSSTPSTSNRQDPPAEFPSAQFDWGGAGLTNPLDGTQANNMLLDLEQLVGSLDISTSLMTKCENSSPLSTTSDWDYWLKSVPNDDVNEKDDASQSNFAQSNEPQSTHIKGSDIELELATDKAIELTDDSESVNSLQLNEIIQEVKPNLENNDFNSFQSFQTTEWSANSVPLRETYIINSNPNLKFDTKTDIKLDHALNGLEPTTSIPTLPRECENTDYDDKTNLSTNVEAELSNFDDEFSEFQSPLATPTTTSLPNSSATNSVANLPPALIPQVNVTLLQPNILEPLKPVQSETATKISETTTQINWPDPGLSDYELVNIKLNYKATNESNTKDVKTDINDDDDWSDFVSNRDIASIQKIDKLNQPERVVTPELSLSIPQLSKLQPPKKPIPTVTAHGLMQSPLAPLPSKIEPLVISSVHSSKVCENGYQPSFISSQFSQLSGLNATTQQYVNYRQENFANIQQEKQSTIFDSPQLKSQTQGKFPQHHLNMSTPGAQRSHLNAPSNDSNIEWSDFVSSQPTPSTISNGWNNMQTNTQLKLNLDWNRPPQFTSWTSNISPNIITNPVPFENIKKNSPSGSEVLANSKMVNKKTANLTVYSGKSTIPSISTLPDLDFIAPKNRTFIKK